MIKESFLDFNYDNIFNLPDQTIKDFLLMKLDFLHNNFIFDVIKKNDYKKYTVKTDNKNVNTEIYLELNLLSKIISIGCNFMMKKENEKDFNSMISSMQFRDTLKSYNYERSFFHNYKLKYNIDVSFEDIKNRYYKANQM